MENKYLRKWVYTGLITVFVVTLIGITAGVTTILFSKSNVEETNYILRDVVDTYIPVNAEVEKLVIQEPFSDETVKVHINYYDSTSDASRQEKSIILYENTYMPSTGILYGSENSFNVLAIYEGEVTNITTDEVFGTIIEIKHDNNFVSKYSSLTNADVSVGDTVQAGETIGTSGLNKAVSISKNMLLFELIHNGEYVNPENYYNKEISE